jgi:uncharacterized protein YaiE (UPF0345 family)
MEKFEKITIVKKANIYFDGRVSSRTVLFDNGERKTLGIMLPGDYEFSTDSGEVIEILGGKVSVLLPGETTWRNFISGEQFDVPAHSCFKLQVQDVVDYCCSYDQK